METSAVSSATNNPLAARDALLQTAAERSGARVTGKAALAEGRQTPTAVNTQSAGESTRVSLSTEAIARAAAETRATATGASSDASATNAVTDARPTVAASTSTASTQSPSNGVAPAADTANGAAPAASTRNLPRTAGARPGDASGNQTAAANDANSAPAARNATSAANPANSPAAGVVAYQRVFSL